MDTMGETSEQQEVVILVVANKEQDKIGVADRLAQGDEWGDCRTTAAGGRIFTCAFPKRVVIDTRPLRNIEGRSPTAIARQWISQNSLRRAVFGRLLFVVCVVRWSVTRERCFGIMLNHPKCWIDVFRLIFTHKNAVLILVNTEGNIVDEAMKGRVAHFLMEHEFATKNIIYADLTRPGECVRTAVEESVSLGKIAKTSNVFKPLRKLSLKRRLQRSLGCFSRLASSVRDPTKSTNFTPATNSAPFLMREVTSGFGPWGPERVILFGRTGSGKSTLAQMLTLGKLDSNSKAFISSSGIRGGTQKVEPGVGRGWHVVDTPGFGEPNDKEKLSTIPTREAQLRVQRYVKVLEGTFSHYLYVVKVGRVDELEVKLWKFFLQLFGEDISYYFSVVVSGADKDWLKENVEYLKMCFKPCRSILCAEFPPFAVGDKDLEAEYQDVRLESLGELEEDLARLGRSDMRCVTGQNSKMHRDNETQRANIDATVEKDLRIRILLGAATIYSAIGDPISRLADLLARDDNVGDLLPDI